MVYVFAVAFRYLTVDTIVGHKYFRSVPFGMKFLMLYAIMPDAIKFVEELGRGVAVRTAGWGMGLGNGRGANAYI